MFFVQAENMLENDPSFEREDDMMTVTSRLSWAMHAIIKVCLHDPCVHRLIFCTISNIKHFPF